MRRYVTGVFMVAALCSITLASTPSQVLATDLAIIGGHDTGNQGVGAECSNIAHRNCNWPQPNGQCDKNAPYCVSIQPSSKTCKFTDGVLHPCETGAFPLCAHRHDVNCGI